MAPNAKEGKAMQRVCHLYEASALLGRKKAADSNLLVDILSTRLLNDWEFMEPLFQSIYERFHNPLIGRNLEWMVNLAKN
jgi:hypothetical protein